MKHPTERRPVRLPLFVQVVTRPPLHDCWSVDISSAGIGLVAGGRGAAEIPAEGEEIDLELALPDSGSEIRAKAEIRWRHDTPRAKTETGVALGLRFTSMSGADKSNLAHYLHDYRFHVAVVFAGEDERGRVELALGATTRLHFAASAAELGEVVSRGDIAAVLFCGDDVTRLDGVIDQAQGRFGGTDRGSHDLAPRVIPVGRVAPDLLVSRFNAGRIFRSLSPPVAPADLHRVVLDACEDYGRRTEERRLSQALERGLLREQARRRPEAQLESVVADRLVHRTPGMARVVDLVRRVAPHRMAVLLQGETGTGKDILARILHSLSDRADADFVVQDCGALPESLLESELFGHVKGAFTGATGDHPGLFRLADGGTIFLDEIENTSPKVQSRLLRVLETGTSRPIGGTQVRQVDVRVVVASNRDLREEVAAGRFRADLFYRLSTFIIDIPPLREREGDILALAHHFRERANEVLGGGATGFSEEAQRRLLAHPWPGNVRELKNVVDRAVLLCDPGRPIGGELLPASLDGDAPGAPRVPGVIGLRERVEACEREAIREALARHRGVVRRAAQELGVSPVTLGRKIRRLGLDT